VVKSQPDLRHEFDEEFSGHSHQINRGGSQHLIQFCRPRPFLHDGPRLLLQGLGECNPRRTRADWITILLFKTIRLTPPSQRSQAPPQAGPDIFDPEDSENIRVIQVQDLRKADDI
jgi:hypothetical protein